MTCVLSFDLGTGSVRAGVYDLEQRNMIAVAEAQYNTTYPRAGWAEQQPDEWWDALLIAGRKAIETIGMRDIAAICVATTASTVAICTRDGKPLRPALLWMDCRATAEAHATSEVNHPVMAYSGGGDAVEWLVPKAMWLARHEPETYAQADIICEALDFINFRLAGEWVGSRMNAACKWNYDSRTSHFVPEVYKQLGIEDLTGKLPQRIIPVGGTIGVLQKHVAEALGLSSCPIIAQGGIDAHIGMLGSDTVEVGSMLAIGGTSNVFLTHLSGYGDVSGFWGPYPNALVDDYWLVEAGQVSTGSILNWLSGQIFCLNADEHKVLIQQASVAQKAGSGLLTLDYWMGNRTPYRDGHLRGAMLGLSLGHGRADIYASAVDSIALGSANVLNALEKRDVTINRIVMAGGICKNPLWLQSTVDALARPVLVAQSDNLSLIGASVSAAHALGFFPDLITAAKNCAAYTEELHPNAVRSAWFADTLELYREATAVLTPTLHRLSARQATGAPV
ncbi:FGGY-family carbohydrate kinase [Brucella thiophenivorans]|uniref:FGGY family of carbohydrate kinase, N-terminal domain protein n=1 Tax=Brucella thiophenivorans TaxID=571255 RepID=A0A256EXX1_9HYPH|nr:FGGY-family carbohydrate kinase [Brucella thiophenivorans]OYR07455.1 FGGY family of carbohydrate kinase, N-terminal domain protein [Brucella thiophenivorans]